MSGIPLVMKTWAGDAPHDMDYITRSIPSLLASDLPDNLQVIIYDDCSPNPSLRNYLDSVSKKDRRVRVIYGEQNKGPNLGQQDLYQQITAEYPDTPFYLNVDDDVVYHRDWLNKLMQAYHACRRMGRNGVFTALHMPFRRHFETIEAEGIKLHLKWKQPALNWLIPREVYEAVGPFRDEGIAYDTVYSHWMRLKGYPIFCMSPSYVQNIGLLGAYATDDTTTALDFVGYSPIQRIQYQLGFHLRRIPEYLRQISDSAAEMIAPVRWGTEFVHEGIRRDGTSVAIYTFDDAKRLGWDLDQAGKRVEQVAKAYMDNKKLQLAPVLHRNRSGQPVRVELPWRFMPNLREARAFNLPKQPTPRALFQALLEQLAPLHASGIAHNKIRPENIYIDQETGAIHLMWLGAEPLPGEDLSSMTNDNIVPLLSGALNRWAHSDVREMFAARYLECTPPEVLSGKPASPQSDIFSVATIVMQYTQTSVLALNELQPAWDKWAERLSSMTVGDDEQLNAVLRRCLEQDSEKRPTGADHALKIILR